MLCYSWGYTSATAIFERNKIHGSNRPSHTKVNRQLGGSTRKPWKMSAPARGVQLQLISSGLCDYQTAETLSPLRTEKKTDDSNLYDGTLVMSSSSSAQVGLSEVTDTAPDNTLMDTKMPSLSLLENFLRTHSTDFCCDKILLSYWNTQIVSTWGGKVPVCW